MWTRCKPLGAAAADDGADCLPIVYRSNLELAQEEYQSDDDDDDDSSDDSSSEVVGCTS
jgi:hypothetical protein